jgi:hypothetical protein
MQFQIKETKKTKKQAISTAQIEQNELSGLKIWPQVAIQTHKLASELISFTHLFTQNSGPLTDTLTLDADTTYQNS